MKYLDKYGIAKLAPKVGDRIKDPYSKSKKLEERYRREREMCFNCNKAECKFGICKKVRENK